MSKRPRGRKPTQTSLRIALAARPLQSHVYPQAGAFKDADISLILLTERARIGDSLDLDGATASAMPQAHRWDYLASVTDLGQIVAIEPHSATDGEIKIVIAKKATAQAYLRTEFKPGHSVSRWYWVTRGRVSFSRMERARRSLDLAGITFCGRQLRSLG